MTNSAHLTPASTTRAVFIVSDGTGVAADAMASSLLSQFNLPFEKTHLPFVDTPGKALEAANAIDQLGKSGEFRPIVFSTLAKTELFQIIQHAHALHFDLMQTFIAPLELELGQKAAHKTGLRHQNPESAEYRHRIDAVNFALAHDDGQSHRNLAEADVILVGVSRSGKTPTSLYLAMQYAIKAANYPLIPEDFERGTLPAILTNYRDKLFGLSIDPQRLAAIRQERRPDSRYALPENCRDEVSRAESMMKQEGIHWLSTTNKSIEEIASAIADHIRRKSVK